MKKPTDFEDFLKEQMKDPEFRRCYEADKGRFQVSARIIELRKMKKLSQAELAKRIGTQQSNVARMEQGEQNFTYDTLEKIAHSFGKELRVEFA